MWVGALAVIATALGGCLYAPSRLYPLVGVTMEYGAPTVVLACGGDVSVFRDEPSDPPDSPLTVWSVRGPARSAQPIDIQIFVVPPGWRDTSVPERTASFPPRNISGSPSFTVVRLEALAPGIHYTASSGVH